MSLDTPFNTRPIDTWPGNLTRNRMASPFRSTWTSTMDLLWRELARLGARDVVLQMALREADIRLDGRPRANARPEHPGVILAFNTPDGPMKMAVDKFGAWKDNLRAIALGLEALRKVERYGIVRRGEQYAGWRQLEQETTPGTTREQAERTLRTFAGVAPTTPISDSVVRRALRNTHPDVGGSDEAFNTVQAARKALEAGG